MHLQPACTHTHTLRESEGERENFAVEQLKILDERQKQNQNMIMRCSVKLCSSVFSGETRQGQDISAIYGCEATSVLCLLS